VKVNGNKVTDSRVDPGATLAISKHFFKLHYDPKKNGATGLPPERMLHGEDILSQSLMQRAGLEKPKVAETVADEPLDINLPVSDSCLLGSATPPPPRDFFTELVFD